MSQFSSVDKALSFAVVSLERFHEVGKRARVRLVADCFVDRQNLLEFVLLFTWLANIIITCIIITITLSSSSTSKYDTIQKKLH